MGLVDAVLARTPRRAIQLASRARNQGRRLRAGRRFPELIERIYPDATGQDLLVATHDSAVYRVATPDGPVILKIATAPNADEQLAVEATALDSLDAIAELGEWRQLVATVLATGQHEAGTWFAQSEVPGEPLSKAHIELADAFPAVVDAIAPAHSATASTHVVDSSVLDRLVSEPISVIERWRPEAGAHLAGVESELRGRLADRELSLSRLHGDYVPSNVLWDRAQGRVSGIIDWKFSEPPEVPEVDLVHFVVAFLLEQQGVEYGDAVRRLLEPGAYEGEARSAVDAAVASGPNRLDAESGLLFSWLHHVSFGLHKGRELRTNPIWLRQNIDLVVEQIP